jgi:hypothetical protein
VFKKIDLEIRINSLIQISSLSLVTPLIEMILLKRGQILMQNQIKRVINFLKDINSMVQLLMAIVTKKKVFVQFQVLNLLKGYLQKDLMT